MGNGRYDINAQGNIYTDRSELREKLKVKLPQYVVRGNTNLKTTESLKYLKLRYI